MAKIIKAILDWFARQTWLPEPLPEVTVPVADKDYLFDMMLAIKQMEGWYIGSRSYRNNNPGNCKFSSVGYLPIYEPVKKDPQGFAVFKDYATGWLYLKNLIKHKAEKHPEWSLSTFFKEYAPDEDNNDSAHYASVVAKAMGVSPFTFQLKDLL